MTKIMGNQNNRKRKYTKKDPYQKGKARALDNHLNVLVDTDWGQYRPRQCPPPEVSPARGMLMRALNNLPDVAMEQGRRLHKSQLSSVKQRAIEARQVRIMRRLGLIPPPPELFD